MKFTLFISVDARQEAMEAYHYYEDRRMGLGDEFLDDLEGHYNKLASNPLAYSFMDNSKVVRDVYLRRFPFIIVFVIINLEVNIISVRHTARKPIM